MIRLEISIPQRYRLSFDKKRVRAVLGRAGAEIASVARRKIRQAAGSGRLYYGGAGKGSHRASLPGQPPASWSGTLANSIRSKPFRGGDGVLIRDAAFYALMLEAGAKGATGTGRKGARARRNATSRRAGIRSILPSGNGILAPRPFLSSALAEREGSIAERVKRAIIEDIEFRRISASAKV
jgi:hypothetical protein